MNLLNSQQILKVFLRDIWDFHYRFYKIPVVAVIETRKNVDNLKVKQFIFQKMLGSNLIIKIWKKDKRLTFLFCFVLFWNVIISCRNTQNN